MLDDYVPQDKSTISRNSSDSVIGKFKKRLPVLLETSATPQNSKNSDGLYINNVTDLHLDSFTDSVSGLSKTTLDNLV